MRYAIPARKVFARVILLLFVTLLLAAFSSSQETDRHHWKKFMSSTGFSIEYPSGWYIKGNSKENLTILSSRGGAEAVIIKDGQAMIIATEDANFLHEPLSQMIDHYTHDDVIISRSNVHNDRAGFDGCVDLTEVVSKEPIVPPEDVSGPVPLVVNTEYFCEINVHKYVTILRNFEGDNKQAQYQRTALRMAQSLRTNRKVPTR